MIDIQRPLSPVLASLLLKEFPHEELAALGCAMKPAATRSKSMLSARLAEP